MYGNPISCTTCIFIEPWTSVVDIGVRHLTPYGRCTVWRIWRRYLKVKVKHFRKSVYSLCSLYIVMVIVISLGQFCPKGKRAMRLTLCEAPTHETRADHTRERHVLLFNHVTLKMQETGPTVYSPYPRRLERLTICRWNYKGSTFYSVILRPQVLVRSRTRTLDLPHSRLALHRCSTTVSLETYPLYFWVTLCLCLKTSPCAKLFIWN